ncbi:MAG: phage protease [Bacillota bacterium]
MQWTTEYINDLPDKCFAYIEPGGRKDEEGKTVLRTLRHLPYRDKDGKIDLPHLRNALARLPQTNLSTEAKRKAKEVLIAAAKEAGLPSYEDQKLAELKIPFFRLGNWKHPVYGEITGDQATFDSFIKNFRENVLGRPIFVRLGHDKGLPTFGAAPAEAWVRELRQEGDTLYAIAEPTTPDIVDAVRNRRYRFASAEYDPLYINKETGELAGPTLTAIALTNEPFLTRLPENVVLADPPDQIYLDCEEASDEMDKKLLEENNSLLKKLSDGLTRFFENFKQFPKHEFGEEEKRKLAEIDDLKRRLADAEKKLTDTTGKLTAAEQKAWENQVESRLKDLVAKGIPPAMCEQVKSVLLANPAAAATVIKLADNKEVTLAEQIFAVLEALPEDQRVKLTQVGSQHTPSPNSPEAIKKLADEDVRALGGKITEDGKYIL